MKINRLLIGWAETSITPIRPLLMEGQMYMRTSKYVHDPITATCLVLDNSDTQAIFVSLDMTEVPEHVFEGLQDSLKDYPEIPYEMISFNVTHTHNSSSFYADFMRSENELVFEKDILPPFNPPEKLFAFEESQKFLVQRLHDLIVRAWQSRKIGGISNAHDYAAIGFNRRPQFYFENNVETVMYGDCSNDNFLGFESGNDNAVELLFTFDENKRVTGVVCNVACPSQVYELHRFLTADFWAPTRSLIREKLGENVYILSTCGAAGDLAPVDLVHISKTNKQALVDWGGQTKEVFRDFDMTLLCQSIGERLSDAVCRGYKTAKNYVNFTPAFAHKVISFDLPIRQVSENDYLEAQKRVEEIHKIFTKDNPMNMDDLVKVFDIQGVILRYQQQLENPEISINCHVVRIDRIAIATNPFELFHKFGLIMKARAKADQLFIIQLANGLGGYLPTIEAVQGGSYSSKPASTICGPDGGEELVRKTLLSIDELFSEEL